MLLWVVIRNGMKEWDLVFTPRFVAKLPRLKLKLSLDRIVCMVPMHFIKRREVKVFYVMIVIVWI